MTDALEKLLKRYEADIARPPTITLSGAQIIISFPTITQAQQAYGPICRAVTAIVEAPNSHPLTDEGREDSSLPPTSVEGQVIPETGER